MRLPLKSSLPFKLDSSKEFVHGLMTHITTKTPARAQSKGVLNLMHVSEGPITQGRAPLGSYFPAPVGFVEEAKPSWLKGPNITREYDPCNVSLYHDTIGDYVRQLYPVPGDARTEYAVGLTSYVAAHELGHKYHLENVIAPADEPPVTKFMEVATENRLALVSASIPRFIYHVDVTAIEGTPLGERLKLRQSYLAGDVKALAPSFPKLNQSQVHDMGGREFTAHMAAMTSLGEYLEVGNIPVETGNIRQEMAKSLLAMNEIIENLPQKERENLFEGLRWLETDGKSRTGVPLLGDKARLQTLLVPTPSRKEVPAQMIDFV